MKNILLYIREKSWPQDLNTDSPLCLNSEGNSRVISLHIYFSYYVQSTLFSLTVHLRVFAF